MNFPFLSLYKILAQVLNTVAFNQAKLIETVWSQNDISIFNNN